MATEPGAVATGSKHSTCTAAGPVQCNRVATSLRSAIGGAAQTNSKNASTSSSIHGRVLKLPGFVGTDN
jgi:hypothetical protein